MDSGNGGYRQHLLSGGVRIPTGNYAGVRLLQLGSDLQKDLTCTGLSPSPARLKLQSSSYCLRHGLFVFSVFYHRDIISRRGGLVKRFSHFSDSRVTVYSNIPGQSTKNIPTAGLEIFPL